MLELSILIVSILMALAYAYANGINDAANAIATVISTRVLTPVMAIGMAAVLNLVGGLTGTAVAKTIGSGIVEPTGITQGTVMAAILASVVWVLVATRFGYPVSVSHSLVAGLVGAGLATGGVNVLIGNGLMKVLLALAFSPILGFIVGSLAMWSIYWLFRRTPPRTVSSLFGKLQIISAAFMAYSHGKNDAQNAIGIIALAWAVYYSRSLSVEIWMPLVCAAAISVGTALGGWRVIRTLGMRVTHLRPVNGFAAEAAAGAVIEAASSIGLPVSTTHTISTAIMGVGATRRLSAVRWGVTRDITLAWLVTYPFCFAVGWVLSLFLGIWF
jgi:PiT family inorganic phosphate transporter